jgi:hypothetical protein
MSGERSEDPSSLLSMLRSKREVRNVDLLAESHVTAAEGYRWRINAGKLPLNFLIPNI